MVQETRTIDMPAQYLADIAAIMTDRPVPAEDHEAQRLESAWTRRPDQDVGGVEMWQLPNGTFIAVASPALRSQLQRSRRVSRH